MPNPLATEQLQAARTVASGGSTAQAYLTVCAEHLEIAARSSLNACCDPTTHALRGFLATRRRMDRDTVIFLQQEPACMRRETERAPDLPR